MKCSFPIAFYMKYNFDKIVGRANPGASKLDMLKELYGRDDLIPLWVADMDFETPSFIVDALKARMEHPLFGYTTTPADYWPAVIRWIKAHHGWEVQEEWLNYIPGVVKGIGFVINALTAPGDKVIISASAIPGNEVTVGRVKEKEVDFVCSRDGRRIYLQVAYLMPTAETRAREFAALASVPDQYRKVVLSMDGFDFSRDGIEHVHLPDFLLDDKD